MIYPVHEWMNSIFARTSLMLYPGFTIHEMNKTIPAKQLLFNTAKIKYLEQRLYEIERLLKNVDPDIKEEILREVRAMIDSMHFITREELTTEVENVISGMDLITRDELAEAAQELIEAHTHTIDEVIGLQTALDGKANTNHEHSISDVNDLEDKLDGKADASHTHSISDVNELENKLDGKADASHTHSISDVNELENKLDGKADSSHTHVIADITDYVEPDLTNYAKLNESNTFTASQTFNANVYITADAKVDGNLEVNTLSNPNNP